jgi:hypothetical protein
MTVRSTNRRQRQRDRRQTDPEAHGIDAVKRRTKTHKDTDNFLSR